MRHRDLAAHPITFAIVLLATLLCGADSLADGRMDRHEGVATCASSTCHAATQALGGHGIRQDEYFTWQQRDAHAGAYRTLLGERSRRMGAKLGIDPASDRACLSCHSDAVPALARGERFLVEDGIGCEACHGGSERWLAAHTEPGIAREEKLRLGMTATWQPAVRAKLCLQCHQGDAVHPITHGMMAAGHPPLLFELDTFSALQPPHHEQDADYTARKGERDAAREWAVGQATAALLRLAHWLWLGARSFRAMKAYGWSLLWRRRSTPELQLMCA